MGEGQTPKFRIEPLGDHHLREAFSCKNEIIDSFFTQRALKDHCRYKVRVRVAVCDDSDEVVGFYSLAIQALAPQKKLLGIGNKFGDRQIPAVYLAMLATNAKHQRQGIGQELMLHAFESTLAVAELAGTACLTLDAVDEEKAAWYEKLSFQRFEPNSLSMYIALGTVREACEAAKQADNRQAA